MPQASGKQIPGSSFLRLGPLLLCLLFPLEVTAGELYRYKNSDGVIVMEDRIPPRYVNDGYEVLSKSGRVVKVVPPYTENSAGTSERNQEARLQREKDDRYLLATYRSLEEIQYSKSRKLAQLEREISIVETNLSDTRQRRENQLARAASFQASGREVPEGVREMLVKLEQEEDKARDLLTTRRQQYETVAKRFRDYESRFLELTAHKEEGASDSGSTGS